jgi:hypothetical protein
VVNQEDVPWCLPCGDSHSEYEYPRRHNSANNEDPNNCEHMNYIDTLDLIYTISSQEYYNVTLEQLEQRKQEAARKARLEILNQMDKESLGREST